MANLVRKRTNEISDKMLSRIKRIYKAQWRSLYPKIEARIIAIYLDDDNATAQKRLKYADKNGKDELIELFVAAVVLVNMKAIKIISAGLEEIYKENASDVSRYIRNKTRIDIRLRGFLIDDMVSKYTKRRYDAGLDKTHVSKEILHEINKMLKAGNGTKKISKRLQKLFYMNKTSADRVTLTETTRIQSRGRWDVMREAEERGMRFKKIWRHAFYVSKPRDWHIDMDGEERDLYEDFSNGGMYPGDPRLPPSEVCNCHCFLDERLVSW